MALTGLREPGLKLVLFGGKGGVGKTTCAASAALYCASGAKTLCISTDPAHSLADSLGQPLGDEITPVQGVENLWGLEVSAEKALAQFKIKYEREIRSILDSATALDQDDINAVLALPIPGLDEVMSFKTIVDLIEAGQFEKYIVDTAPTGHALRLLSVPGLLNDWVKVLGALRWKYHYIVSAFGGQPRSEAADDFLVAMKKAVKHIERLLKDGQRCEFVVVTIPEAMVVAETLRLVGQLRSYGIAVRQLLINQVSEERWCGFCHARYKAQQKWIKVLQDRFGDLHITTMAALPGEVQGLAALNDFKNKLFE